MDPRDAWKLRIIYVVLKVVAVVFFVAWMYLWFSTYFGAGEGWSVLGVLGVFLGGVGSFAFLAGALFVWGVKQVPADRRVVCVLLGISRKEMSSGPCSTIPFAEKLVSYTLKQQEITLRVENIVTAEGVVNKRKFAAAKIALDVSLFFHWGDLVPAVKYGPDPNNPKAIKDHFAEPIADAVKSICAGHTWLKILSDQSVIQQSIAAALVSDPEDPFRRAGIRATDIKVTFPGVHIPEELSSELSKPEIELRKQETAKIRAATSANTIRVEGKAQNEVKREAGKVEAENRADLYNVAKEAGIEFAMLEALVGMAQGKSNTILYGLPGRLQDFMDQHLGGKRPAEIVKALQGIAPETLKEIIRAMRDSSPEAFDKLIKDLEADSKKGS
jgi:hypothetical protein